MKLRRKSHQHKVDSKNEMMKYFLGIQKYKKITNKNTNRTLKDTKWEKRRSRIKFIYRNYRTSVGEVRGDLFKNQRLQKKLRVAELVKSGQQCQKQKKNPSKEGGRYYPCIFNGELSDEYYTE